MKLAADPNINEAIYAYLKMVTAGGRGLILAGPFGAPIPELSAHVLSMLPEHARSLAIVADAGHADLQEVVRICAAENRILILQVRTITSVFKAIESLTHNLEESARDALCEALGNLCSAIVTYRKPDQLGDVSELACVHPWFQVQIFAARESGMVRTDQLPGNLPEADLSRLRDLLRALPQPSADKPGRRVSQGA